MFLSRTTVRASTLGFYVPDACIVLQYIGDAADSSTLHQLIVKMHLLVIMVMCPTVLLKSIQSRSVS